MPETETTEPPEITDDKGTVAALLAPHFTEDSFTLAAGERDGNVIVRPAGDDTRWLVQQAAATLREAGIRVREEDDHVLAQLWPYDADRRDPLVKLRIPVIATPYPDWNYEVCVVISRPGEPDADLWGPALRPDDRETAQIAALLGYRMEYYNSGWKAKMRKRPLDIDGSTNTLVLQKYAEGDWRYRRMSFDHGMWPFYNMEQRFTLEALLDRIYTHGDHPYQPWLDWKSAHPEAFGEVPDGN